MSCIETHVFLTYILIFSKMDTLQQLQSAAMLKTNLNIYIRWYIRWIRNGRHFHIDFLAWKSCFVKTFLLKTVTKGLNATICHHYLNHCWRRFMIWCHMGSLFLSVQWLEFKGCRCDSREIYSNKSMIFFQKTCPKTETFQRRQLLLWYSSDIQSIYNSAYT